LLYQQVLHVDLGEIAGAVRAKKPKRLPVVLTRAEVQSVLALLDGEVCLVCSLLYGAGLRQPAEKIYQLDLQMGG
jgi:integrase